MPDIDELIAVKRRVEAEYLGRPGVTGIDVGYKEVGGQRTDQVAIRVLVERKRDRVPEGQMVPVEIDGVVTDVIERVYVPQIAVQELDVSAQADTTHYASLQGGISMGPSRAINGSIFAGTLGAVVIDNANNQHAALTNFHVAAVDTSWHVGDRMVAPSRIDTGTVPADEFGAIVRATLSGAVDGAVISIDAGRANQCSVVEIGQVRGVRTATMGMAVRKRGRTTGLTFGTVDGIAGSVIVNYGDGIGTRTLTNQISIATDTARNPLFSDHGDSGSVIVDDAGFVVGLLFAGAGSSTAANQITDVQSELNVRICVGKSVIKDLKDGRKDVVKDKELRKELAKEKDLRKEFLPEGKRLKDLRDVVVPGPGLPIPPVDPGPLAGGGQAALEARLAALEAQLATLTSYIGTEERPDLSASAFAGEPALDAETTAALRAELEQQAADAAAAKADFDGPLR